MLSSILEIVSEIPDAIRLVHRMIQKYERQKRIEKENRKRNEVDRIIKERDSEGAKELLSNTLSNIRRSVD